MQHENAELKKGLPTSWSPVKFRGLRRSNFSNSRYFKFNLWSQPRNTFDS